MKALPERLIPRRSPARGQDACGRLHVATNNTDTLATPEPLEAESEKADKEVNG